MGATKKASHFEVDKEGLARILARKGVEFAVCELVSNAWDEDITRVDVVLEPVEGKRGRHRLTVTDDAPNGFLDLKDAYTLFADSYKKSHAEKRGRFNLGEKLVVAVCDEASVKSTTGTVHFDKDGRHQTKDSTEKGSIFDAVIRMTKEEAERTAKVVDSLIPPPGVVTTFNGTELASRKPVHVFKAQLPTEIATEDGLLKPSRRIATIELYPTLGDEVATVYEMGIPVVESGDTWHANVHQKVPLTTDRDNVPPRFLRRLRAETMNNAGHLLTSEQAKEKWVDNALEDRKIKPEAVNTALDKRYGEKRVIFDQSDPEGTKLAVSEGYAVIHGSSLSKKAWAKVREAKAALPAGQVTPSPKVISGPGGLPSIPEEDWTPGMRQIHRYTVEVSEKLTGDEILVDFHNMPLGSHGACFGQRRFSYNVGTLGYRYFDQGISDEINRTIIHELGHHYSSDHLESEFHDALCRLGAKLARLALEEPEFFESHEREAVVA